MKYEDLPPISREELEDSVAFGSEEVASRALLRMALNESDWLWTEEKCLAALEDLRPHVKAAAITSLGHLARIHGIVNRERVVPVLKSLQSDPEVGGIAEDALDDILLFTSSQGRVS